MHTNILVKIDKFDKITFINGNFDSWGYYSKASFDMHVRQMKIVDEIYWGWGTDEREEKMDVLYGYPQKKEVSSLKVFFW